MAVKHHWWWQFNFVFQRLEVAAEGKWTGDVLYIEEDNYVAPDILAVLAQMRSIATEQCGAEKCGMLNLGLKTQEAVSDNGAGWEHRGNALGVAGWESSKHNMGMVRPRAPPLFHTCCAPASAPAAAHCARAFALQRRQAFNREFWSKMQTCTDTFCSYDDYNWDWSTEATISGCRSIAGGGQPLGALVLQGARVYHFGSCGMHVGKGQDCEGKQPDTSAIEAMLTKVTPHLHPSQLQFSNGAVGRPKALVNGGWGDARDVALCKAFGKGQQLDAYTADAGR